MVESAKQAEFLLSPIVAADLSDAEVIALAVRSFATELGLPERTVEIYGDSSPGQRRVLDLHAAALVAVLADAGTGPVRIDIRAVLGERLRHEQHFWHDSARARGLPDGQDGTTARVRANMALPGPSPTAFASRGRGHAGRLDVARTDALTSPAMELIMW
jgi:hypothetical protein